MTIHIIYHKADLDGRCSAAIVLRHVGGRATLHPWNYGMPVPEGIAPGDDVWVVDCCLPKADMVRLHETCHLVWIDHHKTAIDECGGLDCEGLRTVGKAACLLAWECCYPLEKPPPLVRHIGLYDVWDHRDPNTVPLNYAILADQTGEGPLDETVFVLWYRGDIEVMVDKGCAIENWINSQNHTKGAAYCYKIAFHGHRGVICNGEVHWAKAYLDKDTVIAISYLYDPNTDAWRFSLRSESVDCAALAKHYGGGGHKGAAGFEIKGDLPAWVFGK
jgi:oligoribonuclease NrnB/cAMP/cGMP phosphodiesterase (DHH superfamily)